MGEEVLGCRVHRQDPAVRPEGHQRLAGRVEHAREAKIDSLGHPDQHVAQAVQRGMRRDLTAGIAHQQGQDELADRCGQARFVLQPDCQPDEYHATADHRHQPECRTEAGCP